MSAPERDADPAGTNDGISISRSLLAVEGFVERVDASIVSGWIWDRNAHDETLSVEVIGPAGYYARAVADAFRGDLQAAGKRDGRCWFEVSIPAVHPEVSREAVVVLLDGTGHRLPYPWDMSLDLVQDWLEEQDAGIQSRVFVQRSCYDIIGRAPTEAELTKWLPFACGEPTKLIKLVRALSSSRAIEAASQRSLSVEEFVRAVYRGVLGRDAEPAGVNLYGNAIRNGLQLADMIAEFLRTPEFASKANRAHGNGYASADGMRSLATSMERATLTLAISAAQQCRTAWTADIGRVTSIPQQKSKATTTAIPVPPAVSINGKHPKHRALPKLKASRP